MPVVYVIQESPGKNLLDATKFGEVHVLLPPDRQIIFSPGPACYEIRQGLSKFTDEDYLLLLGDPVAISIASSIATDINCGRYKVLKWDKQERRYYPLQIDIYPKGINYPE